MIRHIVLVKFRPDISQSTITSLFDQLSEIQNLVPGIASTVAGRSESPEHLERGYHHGFVVDFEDWEGLERYQQHPKHKAISEQLISHAIGGIDGILVLDIPFS